MHDRIEQLHRKVDATLDGNGGGATIKPFPFERLDAVTLSSGDANVQGMGIGPGLTIFTGAPGSGKSTLAVNLANAIACGSLRWFKLKIKSGPVLYISPEAPASLKMRAIADRDRHHFGKSPRLYVSGAVPALGSPDEGRRSVDVARILEMLDEIGSNEGEPVLMMVLDTLASCLGGGTENSDGMVALTEAGKAIAAARGIAVVFIHHPSKADGSKARGHGSLEGAADTIIAIEIEQLTGVRVATLVKSRDTATGLKVRYLLEMVSLEHRDPWGDVLTTVVVMPADDVPEQRRRPSGRQQGRLLDELERQYRTGAFAWDQATVDRAGRDLGMPDQSARDARAGLIKTGYLRGPSSSLTLADPPTEGTK